MKRKCVKCASKLRLSRAQKRCSKRKCNVKLIKKELKRLCLRQKCRVNESKYRKVDSCYAKMSFKCSPRSIWNTKRCVPRPLQQPCRDGYYAVEGKIEENDSMVKEIRCSATQKCSKKNQLFVTGLQTCVKKQKCARNMIMELSEGKCISMLKKVEPS